MQDTVIVPVLLACSSCRPQRRNTSSVVTGHIVAREILLQWGQDSGDWPEVPEMEPSNNYTCPTVGWSGRVAARMAGTILR